MTREEKIALFDDLCLKKGIAEVRCQSCSKYLNELCEKKVSEDFTDEELDIGLAHLQLKADGQDDFDVVSKPKHYASTSIECIDAMIETQGKEAVRCFCICNAFKYLWRHNSKNGDEDIKKANWYLTKAVELMEGGQHENQQED